MAEVNTDIYKSLGQNNQSMSPLQIMQLIGQVNQNKLFNQTYDARQGIGEAYSQNVGPDGKINTPGLIQSLTAKPNFLAGDAVNQGITNATNQFSLDTGKTKYAQQTLSALASKKDLAPSDFASWSANAARAGVDPSIIHGVLNDVYSAGNNPKALREAVATQGIMSMGTDALSGEAGPPDDSGTATTIPKGQAINQRMQPGGMATTNPPGFQEAAAHSGQMLAAARDRANTWGSDNFVATNLLNNLEKLGPSGTGPGTKELNNMKAFVQSNLNWLPGADKLVGDPNKIDNYYQAEKYATQLAGSRASMFGGGTDQSMSLALTGSPSTHIANMAGQDLTKAVIGLRNMEQVQTSEADRLGIKPGQYSSWASRWVSGINPQTMKPDKNYAIDPNAFMAHLMTPEQLQNYSKTLNTPAKRDKFNRSYQLGLDNGVIDDPSGQHTGAQ